MWHETFFEWGIFFFFLWIEGIYVWYSYLVKANKSNIIWHCLFGFSFVCFFIFFNGFGWGESSYLDKENFYGLKISISKYFWNFQNDSSGHLCVVFNLLFFYSIFFLSYFFFKILFLFLLKKGGKEKKKGNREEGE